MFGLKPRTRCGCSTRIVGGAFGSGLRPQYQLFLAVLAAPELERSVRVVLTREQMFSFGLPAGGAPDASRSAPSADGTLQALRHDAVAETSRFEDYQEVVVNWSGLLYRCDNVALDLQARASSTRPRRATCARPARSPASSPSRSRWTSWPTRPGIDPLALRLKNYAERRDRRGQAVRLARSCAPASTQGAERFGWAKRTPEPRSMREGRELVGWGMATGVWEAMMHAVERHARR